jgi:hypothetical protein
MTDDDPMGTYTLSDYIRKFYDNYKTGFAKAVGVPSTQITKWLVNENIISNGMMYSKRRRMPLITNPTKEKV